MENLISQLGLYSTQHIWCFALTKSAYLWSLRALVFILCLIKIYTLEKNIMTEDGEGGNNTLEIGNNEDFVRTL